MAKQRFVGLAAPFVSGALGHDAPQEARVHTPIVVISRASATDRRTRFRDRAEKASASWEFVDASEELFHELKYDEEAAIIATGRPLSGGEIGCYSSHYSLWARMRDEDISQLIVLEDDTVVDWNFLGRLAAVNLPGIGVDYLRLYYKRPAQRCTARFRNFVEGRRYVVSLRGYVYGTQGYILTRSGALRFLRHCRIVSRPIDNEMDRSWAHGIPNLSVFPFPLFEESGASTIGLDRFEPFEMSRLLRLRRRGSRAAERLRYRLEGLFGPGRWLTRVT
jgi:glycosyl transferase, family 25